MRDWRKDHPAATQHDLDLGHTFTLSWEAIKDETTQKIFLTAGYLAPNSAIPLEIFEKALKITGDACDEALDILYGLGLLRKSEDSQPTIHPLLAEYARSLAKEKKEILESLADVLETLSHGANETGLPFRFVPLRSHIPVTASHAEEAGLQYAGTLWSNYGYHLKKIADYSSAITMYERALKTFRKHLGEEHTIIAIPMSNLGEALRISGDLAGARAMLERALKIDEAAFGPDHPNVAIRVNNLGGVMLDSGDLTGARTMYERAIKIDENSFGPNHPSVARDVHNLGILFDHMSDKENAIACEKRALVIFQKTLPPDHPYIKMAQEHLDSLNDS